MDPSSPFSRTYWILGLPFDAVDLGQATARILASVKSRQKLLIATPNANFLTMASRDVQFTRSILECDFSLADGMPVIWLARLLGVPLKERVAGSSLFEHLAESSVSPPVAAFFFGGPPGAAEAACASFRERTAGVRGAGWYFPAFGDIASMSAPGVIDAINAQDVDFLVVALGAAKGHQWIVRNRDQLRAPVISHLGAVVNFAAGTLKRAPRSVQRAGLEWLWRLVAEPRLWRRYLADAIHLSRLAICHALPLRLARRPRPGGSLIIQRTMLDSGSERWSLSGQLVSGTVGQLRTQLQNGPPPRTLDVSGLDAVDAEGLGALYAATWRAAPPLRPVVEGRPACWREVALHRAQVLFPAQPD